MGFMLGSIFSRSKLPLKASRFCLESLESLSFLLDPSWAFVSHKKNYFYMIKNPKSGLIKMTMTLMIQDQT